MKGQKRIKKVLAALYNQGIHDGMDILRGSNDRFFGDIDARQDWEKRAITASFNEIKLVVDSTPPATAERKE